MGSLSNHRDQPAGLFLRLSAGVRRAPRSPSSQLGGELMTLPGQMDFIVRPDV